MNVILTGVSKGLGLETANTLLHKGYFIYGISRNESNELKTLLKKYPETFKWKPYDLIDSENIHQEIFKKWIGLNTPIHGLINNAAIAYDDIATNLNLNSLSSMFHVNVFSAMALTKYTIRQMLLHNIQGSLVHISSISVHTGYKGLSMYASTKGAIEAFSKNIAREWGEKGIRSNCVVSGFMETEMSSSLTQDQKHRIYQRTSLKKPVDRISVTETIHFLLSEAAISITGQNIHVDNGTI